MRNGVRPPISGTCARWNAAETVVALGRALGGGVEAVFFTKTNRPGLLEGTDVRPDVRLKELAGEAALPEPEAVRRVAAAGVAARVTNVGGFLDGAGTRVSRNEG